MLLVSDLVQGFLVFGLVDIINGFYLANAFKFLDLSLHLTINYTVLKRIVFVVEIDADKCYTLSNRTQASFGKLSEEKGRGISFLLLPQPLGVNLLELGFI